MTSSTTTGQAVDAEAHRPTAPQRVAGFFERATSSWGGYTAVLFALFVLGWLPAIACLVVMDRSFFWVLDALSQQYVWFVYTGQWLRELAGNVFIDHSFVLPMWTFDNGFGIDVLQSVVCTVFNPFYAVSAFVPEIYAEYAFEVSLLLYIFCAGLAFSAWCAHHGVPRMHVLLGALAYMFSGSMACVFAQPCFLFAPVAFPLAILGVDRIFEERKPGLYIAVMAWSFAYSFYDSYMMAIMIVLYCLLVFFVKADAGLPAKGKACRLLKWVLVFAGYTAIALLISCAVMLPQVMALVGSSRLELVRTNNLLYPFGTYSSFFLGFVSFGLVGHDAYTGFVALVPVALVALWVHRRDHRILLACFVALTVMILFPIFGRVMNAMEYPTDRWSWVYSLCAAFILARMVCDIQKMPKGVFVAMAVVSVAIMAVLYGRIMGLHVCVSLAVLAVVCSLIAVFRDVAPKVFVLVLIGGCLLSGATTFATYVLDSDGMTLSMAPAGSTWKYHSTASVDGLIGQVEGYDEGQRYDRPTVISSVVHNSNLITGHMAPDFYNSIYNQGIDDFFSIMGLVDDEGVNNHFGALSSRAYLEALLGVEYFYIADEDISLLPGTFDGEPLAKGVSTDGRMYGLYQTDCYAPLAFLMPGYITRSEFDELGFGQRQEVMLQAVVLEDGEVPEGIPHADDISYSSTDDGSVEILEVANASILEGSVETYEFGATLLLVVHGTPESEIYLTFDGFSFTGGIEHIVEDGHEDFSMILCDLFDNVRHYSNMAFWMQGTYAPAQCFDSEHAMYGGKSRYVINLGYSQTGEVVVGAYLSSPGVYAFDRFAVVSQPLDELPGLVEDIRSRAAEDLVLGDNAMSCRVDAPSDSVLFLSIADSKGWTAYVDGEPTEILKADVGFMGVPVTAGEHVVTFEYRTPYLYEGAVLSVAGVVAAVGAYVFRKQRQKVASNA